MMVVDWRGMEIRWAFLCCFRIMIGLEPHSKYNCINIMGGPHLGGCACQPKSNCELHGNQSKSCLHAGIYQQLTGTARKLRLYQYLGMLSTRGLEIRYYYSRSAIFTNWHPNYTLDKPRAQRCESRKEQRIWSLPSLEASENRHLAYYLSPNFSVLQEKISVLCSFSSPLPSYLFGPLFVIATGGGETICKSPRTKMEVIGRYIFI